MSLLFIALSHVGPLRQGSLKLRPSASDAPGQDVGHGSWLPQRGVSHFGCLGG